jgi:hypothetical protein
VDLDSHFFESAPSYHASHDATIELEERDPRTAWKSTPRAALRRAHLTKYVKGAVALASALCLAALVKVAVARGHGEEEAPPRRPLAATAASASATGAREMQGGLQLSAAAEIAPAPVPAQPSLAEGTSAPAAASGPAEGAQDLVPPPASAGSTQEPAPAQPSASAAASGEVPAVASAPSASAPAAAATPVASAAPQANDAAGSVAPAVQQPRQTAEPAGAPKAETADGVAADPAQAQKQKDTARIALERGKVADSIEAGEKSVELDPTDGEAWLILGAAYQQRGDAKNARRCYKACMERGTRGPRSECAAMLR